MLTGEPRQDAFALSANAQWLFAVVSDGIGFCEYSQHGAAIAVHAVAAALALADADPADGESLMKLASGACRNAAEALGAPTTPLAATRTAAVEVAAQPDGGRQCPERMRPVTRPSCYCSPLTVPGPTSRHVRNSPRTWSDRGYRITITMGCRPAARCRPATSWCCAVTDSAFRSATGMVRWVRTWSAAGRLVHGLCLPRRPVFRRLPRRQDRDRYLERPAVLTGRPRPRRSISKLTGGEPWSST